MAHPLAKTLVEHFFCFTFVGEIERETEKLSTILFVKHSLDDLTPTTVVPFARKNQKTKYNFNIKLQFLFVCQICLL
jgi:hypothetical protein